jgi:hypothetical protein
MKKSIALLIIVAVLSATVIVSLAGCKLFKGINVDDAKSNLEAAKYEITELSGKEFVQQKGEEYPFVIESELERYLCAVKGDEKIEIFVFTTTRVAERNYDSLHINASKSGQSNEVIYFATKQAYADAKI